MSGSIVGKVTRRKLHIEPLEDRVLLDVAPIGPILSPDNEEAYNFAYYNQINQSYATANVPGLLRIHTAEDAVRVRNDLVRFVWKDAGFPSFQPQQITPNVASPLGPRTPFPQPELPNLQSVDRLTTTHDFGYQSNVYFLHPRESNQRLAIWVQGHDYDLGATGGYATVSSLLQRGYSVLTTWLPMYGDNEIHAPLRFSPTCIVVPGDDHPDLACGETAAFTPIKFFVEPVAVALNYALEKYAFADVTMIGLSGGGWLTTVYAALDPRVRISIPVAGSQPNYLRTAPYISDQGDWEQFGSAMYGVADFIDMYVLGAVGPGRRQLQVLNKFDDCCFTGVRFRTYLDHVKDTVAKIGGAFDVFLDDAFRGDGGVAVHQVSPFALATAIAHTLDDLPVQIVEDGENTYWNGGGTDRDVFTATGDWTEHVGIGFGRDARTAGPAGRTTGATWQFKVAPGRYQIAVTWIPGVLGVTDAAPFSIFDGPTLLGRVNVNQQLVPDDFREDGANWKVLGEFVVTGTQLQVRLGAQLDASVIADAVRIAPASNREYVRRLYRDLLQRDADASGLDAFTTLLNESRLNRTQAVQALLGSREYRELAVRGLYRELLRRNADAAGLAGFVTLLENGGSAGQVRAALLASTEYFQGRGGENNSSFVSALYQDVLGRVHDLAGLTAFVRLLGTGTSRGVVVQQMVNSSEARQRLLTGFYRRFLERSPDAAGLAAFTNALQRGLAEEQVIAALMGSVEYFQRNR